MNWLKNWLKQPVTRRARRRAGFRPGVEALEERQVPTVNFYGGNVLANVEAQPLYLGSQWTSSANTALKTTLDAFAQDITGSRLHDRSGQRRLRRGPRHRIRRLCGHHGVRFGQFGDLGQLHSKHDCQGHCRRQPPSGRCKQPLYRLCRAKCGRQFGVRSGNDTARHPWLPWARSPDPAALRFAMP